MLERGTIIGGKYEIIELIGKGGTAKVYLAMDKRLNKKWAIKEIEKSMVYSEAVLQGYIREINMIKQLNHPAIPRIVDIIDDSYLYIVQDYIEGKTLARVLEDEGPQPQEIVVEWARKICDVLKYLHTRMPCIIYRDMKPSNVMLTKEGNLKIVDFGIAREYKEGNIADTTSLGTKGYAAPEQYGGMGQTDCRTDIYCLGVTLHQLVTGQNPCEPPYELYPIRYWNIQLSKELERIIIKCTQLNPMERYQTCEELIYDLEHIDIHNFTRKNKFWRNIFLKNVLNKLVDKKKRYINQGIMENKLEKGNPKYYAKVIAGIRRDERDCSIIKGPNYDEYNE